MLDYNDFLFENVWEGTTILDEKGFWKLFEQNCSNFNSDILITKFMRNFYKNDFFLIDEIQERRSVTHGNYYTLLINHSKPWIDYPKREQICELNGYWSTNDIKKNFIVIPYNNSKWGVAPNSDIWWVDGLNDTKLQYMYMLFQYQYDNYFFKISDKNWETFKRDIEKLSHNNIPNTKSRIFSRKFGIKDEDMVNKYDEDLMKALEDIFEPRSLGFEVSKYEDLNKLITFNYNTTKHRRDKYEIWTDSPCLYVKRDLYFDKILPKIKEKNV